MKRSSMGWMPKLLPVLLAVAYGGAAQAFDPIKLDDGTTIDVSLSVSYQNLKRISEPSRVSDYRAQPSRTPGVVMPGFAKFTSQPNIFQPNRGSMWGPAVDVFTQLESALNMDDASNVVNKHGTISNRVSGLLDVNITKNNYRAFFRVNSFRDAKLFEDNDNYSQGTFNGIGPSNRYSDTARDLIGQRTRLLDAYVQGRWLLGNEGQHPLFVRVGRQVVNWGEGLFFQGIGSSMNPMDQVKGMTPGVPAQEAFLPSEQIFASLGINEDLSVMAYYKWKFRETELAPSGTYFSAADFLGPGGQFQYALPWRGLLDAMVGANPLLSKIPQLEAWVNNPANAGSYGAWRRPDVGRKNGGQWGVAAKYQMTDTLDVGLYYLKYTETVGLPQMYFGDPYMKLGQGLVNWRGPNANASAALLEYAINGLTPFNSSYAQRYMNDINLLGTSFSTVFGDWQVAGEFAYRDGAPIMMNDLHYNLAKGKVSSLNLSFLRAWSGNDFFWGMTGVTSAVLGGELAVQHLNGFETPATSINPWMLKGSGDINPLALGYIGRDYPLGPATARFDKNAAAYVARLQLDYNPWPEWDLSIPVFYWRQLLGNGAMQGGWNSGLGGKGSARASIDANFTYRQNLTLGVSATWWLGDYDLRFHTMNNFADRDLVAFNASYHF